MSIVHPGIQSATYDATDRSNVAIAIPEGKRYDKHILTIVCTGTPSGGTVTVRVKATGSSRFLALKDKLGVAVTIPLATSDHVIIEGGLDAVQLDIASLATATGWYALLSPVE